MLYSNIKMWIPVNNMVIPHDGIKNKNVSLIFMGENSSLLNTYQNMNIKRSNVKHVYIPTILRPIRSWMDNSIRKKILNYKLIPVRGVIGNYSDLEGINFFYDTTLYFDSVINRYKIKKFNTSKTIDVYKNFLNTFNELPSNKIEKALIYAIDMDKPFNTNLFTKKFFPIYYLLNEWKKGKYPELPFDKVFFFVKQNKDEESYYVKVFDKSSTVNNINKIKIILNSFKLSDQLEAQAKEELISSTAAIEVKNDESISTKLQGNMKDIVWNFLNLNSSEKTNKNPDISKLSKMAIVYHSVGNMDKSKEFVNSISDMDVEKQKKIINKLAKNVLVKKPAFNVSRDTIIRLSKPEQLVDYKSPGHIFEKRKLDFGENFKNDIKDAFSVLNKKDFPLTVEDITIETMESGPSEIYKTIRDRYTVKLRNHKNKVQEIHIDFPSVDDWGSFYLNGSKWILVNQLVRFPIFFPSVNVGRFESSFSTMKILSKQLVKGSYLQIFIGSYKLPLIQVLSYLESFDKAMKDYGVKYVINSDKNFIINDKEESRTIKINNENYIHLSYNEENLIGKELVESLNKSSQFLGQDVENINDKIYWRSVIEKDVGNRNAPYILDQILNNIVTPVEVSILGSRNYPTNIYDIMKYICEQIVTGRVDDWNSTDNLRVRTAEVFTSLLNKQIHAAYNEYAAKLLGGDKDAQMFINPTKVLSEILISQNTQQLENINPLEELSMVMKVSPIGLGGISKSEAWPRNAMNIHYSGYGNIDPLETPDSENIGILQHLAIGASITSTRGLFAQRDRKDIKPSEILSPTASVVPFVNNNDGLRVLMSTAQSKQAIPLLKSEIPAVQTGFESILTPLLSEAFIKKAPVDGVVTESTDRYISIKDKNNKIHNILTTPYLIRSGQGKHGLSVFKSIVKQGQNVKKNSIIAEGSNINNGIISNGVNMLVAFMPWKGYNFEDGMVISEDAAKKLTSIHVENQQVYLDEDQDVSFIVNIGDYVKKGDILITYSNTIYDIETLNHLRADGGKIVNIEIYSNVDEETIPDNIRPVYENFKKEYILKNKRYPIGHFKEKNKKFKGILIKFTIQQELALQLGDKLNNRLFNKGVCFLSDTEVFTKNGWKLIKDIDINIDEVAYMKDENKGIAGFTKPTNYIELDYTGKMYECSHRRLDYCVTADHDVYCRTRGSGYKKEKAEYVHNKQRWFKVDFNLDDSEFNNVNSSEDYLILENTYSKQANINNPLLKFKKDILYKFYGWFLSEGCLYKTNIKDKRNPGNYYHGYKIIITQSKNEEYIKEISDILNEMGIKWCKSNNSSNFVMSHKPLFEYLEKFCGGYSYNKFIPEELFNTSRENLQNLFDNLIKGDGSFRTDSYINFFSTSYELAKGVERLATLLGYFSIGIATETKDRVRPKYILSISTSKKEVSSNESYKTFDYEGKVYCLTVPNNLLYVRRNQKPLWSGNCSLIVPTDEMPMTPFGERIDMIYSTLSVINRMNPGQLFEIHCSMIGKQLGILMTKKDQKSFIETLKIVLKFIDATDNKQYTANLISSLVSMSPTMYNKLVEEVRETGFFPLIFTPFKTPKVDDILEALKFLNLKARYPLYIPEYKKYTEPIAIGYMYVNKLEHLSEKKIHGRSTGPYTSVLLTPSHGKKKSGGQKFGEYDVYSLLAWECPIVIDEMFGPMSSDHKTKNEIITEIVNNGKSNFKAVKSNPVKDVFSYYMMAIHLQSE